MTTNINPLLLLAKKQTLGRDIADQIALQLLLCFDAAKRGMCPTPCANTLAEQMVIAAYIARRGKAPRFLEQVTRAYDALSDAMRRPTRLLDLTTGEYIAIKAAIASYLRLLPAIEAGVWDEANAELWRLTRGDRSKEAA